MLSLFENLFFSHTHPLQKKEDKYYPKRKCVHGAKDFYRYSVTGLSILY